MGLKESGLRGSLRNVSVGIDAIPDSVVNHWPHDEGTGTTLNDNEGTVDGTISGATWTALEDAVGGQYLEYDGDENNTSLGDDPVNYIYNGDYTFTTFIRPDSSSGRNTIWAQENGIIVRFEDGTSDLRIIHSGIGNEQVNVSFSQGEWHFFCMSYNSQQSEYDITVQEVGQTEQTDTVSIDMTSEPTNEELLFAADPEALGERNYQGGKDETTFSDSILTDEDKDQLKERRNEF